jgi:hypothetical protein
MKRTEKRLLCTPLNQFAAEAIHVGQAARKDNA